MARNSKPIYQVVVKVEVEVMVAVVAENVQEAVELAANFKAADLVKAADEACSIEDWSIPGVLWIGQADFVPFKK